MPDAPLDEQAINVTAFKAGCLAQIDAVAEVLRDRPQANPALSALINDVVYQMDALAGQLRSSAELASHATPEGAADFELQQMGEEKLYEKVLRTAASWDTNGNLMFVIGATQASEFENIRRIVPDHFFLVPGVGAQGGFVLREIL